MKELIISSCVAAVMLLVLEEQREQGFLKDPEIQLFISFGMEHERATSPGFFLVILTMQFPPCAFIELRSLRTLLVI